MPREGQNYHIMYFAEIVSYLLRKAFKCTVLKLHVCQLLGAEQNVDLLFIIYMNIQRS